MSSRILGGLCTLALAAVALPGVARAQAMKMDTPHYKQASVTGTVVDVSCKFGHGLTGAEHRMCAQVCADKGIPLAILGTDGKLYIPTSTDMPGGSQNALLREHAEQQVTVTGKVFEAGGAMAIQIDKVMAKS